MLIPAIRKSVPSNLRRIAAYVTHRNKTKTKFLRYYYESDLLSTSSPSFTACRIYSSEPESELRLPMLIDGASPYSPTPLTPLKLLYLSIFKITPNIDKEFNISEVLQGAKYATVVISNALANNNFESLEGLVADDMIEILKTRIETFSPNQKQLIAMQEKDILFYVLADIEAVKDDESFIEVTIIGHYMHGLEHIKQTAVKWSTFVTSKSLICNYKFTRKYVNNVGGPWIATFVNHYTFS